MVAGLRSEDKKRALLFEIEPSRFVASIYGDSFSSYPYLEGGGDYITELRKLNPETLLPIVEELINEQNS